MVDWSTVKLASGALHTGVDTRSNLERHPAPKIPSERPPTVDDVKFRITELHRAAQQSTVPAARMLEALGTFGISDSRVIAAARRGLEITTEQHDGGWFWRWPTPKSTHV